jgi:hypothetical protein
MSRALAHAAGFELRDPDGWIPLLTFGEHPNPASGLVQVVDRDATRDMIHAFARDASQPNWAGVLLDFDHQSEDLSKPSIAAGWITELGERKDALWGQVRWTAAGQSAVENGEFRYVSPVFARCDCEVLNGNRVRPRRLASAALTNCPNIKTQLPITNRRAPVRATLPAPAPLASDDQSDEQTARRHRNRAQFIARAKGWDFNRAWSAVREADRMGVKVEDLPSFNAR